MSEPLFRLCVPADAAFGVTVRAFAASVARGFPTLRDGSVDDIRLVASELLANAVEAGESTLEFELAPGTDGATWQLSALGVGDLEAPIVIGSSRIRRIDVLRGISEVHVDGQRIVCTDTASPS